MLSKLVGREQNPLTKNVKHYPSTKFERENKKEK